jgi:DNA-binding winged helix-turn-helix (wHTH) protein/tetratricopeptide (TPR) repeat protein
MTAVRYVSHEVVLEPDQWQVRVGQAVLVPEPKVFELLCYLMRHTGRVVSKAELLDALWSGDVVGESVLTRCISCARKLLGDDSKTPRFIRTFHGRGYEFIAPVSEIISAEQPRAAEDAERAPDSGLRPEPSAPERNFVGRRSEAQTLKDALRSVGAERSSFILLSGEAGIGKTRLLREATRSAPPGVEVHWGSCSPVEGAPPFLVWQQCFRSIVRLRTIKTTLRAFGDAASEARRLLLDTDRGHWEENPAWDSPSKRFRLFDAIAQGIAELSARRPLVFVLDDLHFADLGSLLLLEFLVQQRTPSLRVLAAVREPDDSWDESRGAVLAKLRAACRSEITLSGLDVDEVGQFVEQRVDGGARGLAGLLHARTGGNPFFLSVLTASGDLVRSGTGPLPTAIRQAVSLRLSSLSAPCVALLRLASVAGRELDVSVLARAGELVPARALTLLEEAVSARVITQVGPGEHRFVHDLMREVLYAEMAVDARSRAHLAIGRALELTPEYRQARHAAVLAHHFVQGAHFGGASRALDLSIRAGAYALRHFAYEEAIAHFTRGRELLGQGAEADGPSEHAVLLDLGLAQISAGQREQGQRTLNLAASKARELGAASELASVALNLSPGLFAIEVGGFDAGLVALLREALAQVGGDNERLSALLLARLALALYWADTFDERVAICAEANRLAQRLGADDVKAAVVTSHALALSRPANLAERRHLSQQAVDLCGRVGDYHGLLLNRLHRAALILEEGDVATADFEAEAFRKLANEVNQPQALWIARALQASRLLLDGRLAEVEAIAGECLRTGQRVRDHNALQTFGVHLTLVRVEQGRSAEMLESLRGFATSYPRTVAWRALYAYALSRSGDHEACAREYESTKKNGFEQPDDLLWLLSMASLSEVCHAQNDAEGAALLYERFAPFASRFVVIGFAIACLGSVERYLGLLCATMGRRDAAAAHFERALSANRRVHGALPLAYTSYDYAKLLLSQGNWALAEGYLRDAEVIASERNLVALAGLITATRAAGGS